MIVVTVSGPNLSHIRRLTTLRTCYLSSFHVSNTDCDRHGPPSVENPAVTKKRLF